MGNIINEAVNEETIKVKKDNSDIKQIKFSYSAYFKQDEETEKELGEEKGVFVLKIKKEKSFKDILNLLKVDTPKDKYISFLYNGLEYSRPRYKGFFIQDLSECFLPLLTDDDEVQINFNDAYIMRSYILKLKDAFPTSLSKALSVLKNTEKNFIITYNVKQKR